MLFEFDRGLIREQERPYLLEAAIASFDRVKRVTADPELGPSTVRVILEAGVSVTTPSPTHQRRMLCAVAGAVLLHRRVALRVHSKLVELFVSHGAAVDEMFEDATEDTLCQIAKIAGNGALLECVFTMGANPLLNIS